MGNFRQNKLRIDEILDKEIYAYFYILEINT